jgi:hypothetical protein
MGRNNTGMATRTLSLSCIAEVALVLMRISVEDASTMSTYVDASELFGIASDLEDESPLVGVVVWDAWPDLDLSDLDQVVGATMTAVTRPPFP